MDQQRLFRLMPPVIDLLITPDHSGTYSLLITDRPAGVPWSDLEPQRYEQLTADELFDVVAAHLSHLA